MKYNLKIIKKNTYKKAWFFLKKNLQKIKKEIRCNWAWPIKGRAQVQIWKSRGLIFLKCDGVVYPNIVLKKNLRRCVVWDSLDFDHYGGHKNEVYVFFYSKFILSHFLRKTPRKEHKHLYKLINGLEKQNKNTQNPKLIWNQSWNSFPSVFNVVVSHLWFRTQFCGTYLNR